MRFVARSEPSGENFIWAMTTVEERARAHRRDAPFMSPAEAIPDPTRFRELVRRIGLESMLPTRAGQLVCYGMCPDAIGCMRECS